MIILIILGVWVSSNGICASVYGYGADSSGAVDGMKFILGSNVSGGVYSNPNSNPDEEGDSQPEKKEAEEEDLSSCGPEALVPVEVCEIAQGLLCLNTPLFSVDDEHMIVKGTVDRRTSAFSHLRIYSQHEYTKGFVEVKPKSWAEEKCWEEEWVESYDACLDIKGYFAVKIPLPELGPYTIMIDAVGMVGKAVSKTLKTSRVIPPELAADKIELSPNPAESGGVLTGSKVRVIVDLLGDCSFCDFIGASTNGVMVTVTNMIRGGDDSVKTIVRRANISSAGRYDICVPVLAGRNELFVKACNAATPEDSCPEVGSISFEAASKGLEISISLPDTSKLIYDAKSYPSIPLKFRVDGYDHGGECKKGDVTVAWNKNEPVSVCPDGNGNYAANLIPEVGINVGIIDANVDDVIYSKAFMFGWGSVINPYLGPDAGWIDVALQVGIGSEYLNESLRPLINDFLNSENLGAFIADIMSGQSGATSEVAEGDKDKISTIMEDIPYCSSASGFGDVRIELVGEPRLKRAELKRFLFENSSIGFKLDVEGMEVHIKIFRDENGDDIPDEEALLPLLLSFRGVELDGRLKVVSGEKPLILVTSDHTDCDFRSSAYCDKKPALLIPQNIVGGATKGGSFVRCDDVGQQISKEMDKLCEGFNRLGGQTSYISQKVLDALNDMLYCNASAYLTYLMRDAARNISFSVGCDKADGNDSCNDLPALLKNRLIHVAGGIDSSKGKIDIGSSGVNIVMPGRFGGDGVLAKLDSAAGSPGVGVLTDPNTVKAVSGKFEKDAISLSLSADFINELLYQLAFQKEGSGLFDWKIDHFFFEELGFDFVKECDAFDPTEDVQKPPALCQLEPRVGKMLGTALSTYGYFGQKHPIRLEIVGSREIAPHVRFYRGDVPFKIPAEEGEDEVKVEYQTVDVMELQVPDLTVSFYAFEIDESAGKDIYGNPMMLTDEKGGPVLRSMIKGASSAVPIISAKVTLILALQVGRFETLAEDSTELSLTVRPIPEFTKIVFREIAGGNATIVPDTSLLSAFREKINYGVEIYGVPDEAISVSVPKSEMFGSDLFAKLGLEKITFGKEGFVFELDHENQRINFSLKPRIK